MKIWRWAAVAALVLAGPAAFGQEPIIPPAGETDTASVPQEATVEIASGCAACEGGHADGTVGQRIVDWILYRPTWTGCCWGGGCGCGCHECYCLNPHTWEFFPCCGQGVIHAPCGVTGPRPPGCPWPPDGHGVTDVSYHDQPDCGCGCGSAGHALLSLSPTHP
jgi:hypothetical protein